MNIKVSYSIVVGSLQFGTDGAGAIFKEVEGNHGKEETDATLVDKRRCARTQISSATKDAGNEDSADVQENGRRDPTESSLVGNFAELAAWPIIGTGSGVEFIRQSG